MHSRWSIYGSPFPRQIGIKYLKTLYTTTSGGVLFLPPEKGFGANFWLQYDVIGIKAYYYENNTPLNFNTNTWFCILSRSATTFGTKERERFHQLAQADMYVLGTIPIISSVVAGGSYWTSIYYVFYVYLK